MSLTTAVATPQLASEAETLIRSLAGVVSARVHASESGIDAIHVDVCDSDRAAHVSAHVRSALLAGLATPVTPTRIHVRVVERDDDTARPPGPRHRLRLLQDAEERETTSPVADPEPEPPDVQPRRPGPEPAGSRKPDPPVTERPRLVAVDLERPGDGRVTCTVTVAYRTDVHASDAVAVDLPGAAAQAAAQATVRALADAGLDGLELDGLREVEIAGREYVLVALRRTNHDTRVRSGSAPITGAPERAAALAAVDAARTMT